MPFDGSPKKILLTGGTGYVGGRLLGELETRGYAVRCLARRPDFLRQKAAPSTQILRGDLLDLQSVRHAMQGMDAAFYLVHNLGSSGEFEQEELDSAKNFAQVAKEQGVKRIIYLGGLGPAENLSPHLQTRHAVGAILRDSGIQTIEFRASLITGSGSISFAMVRSTVDKLPIMIMPRWLRVKLQPIAIRDVLDYLLEAVEINLEGSHVFEIGGSDQVSLQEVMAEYALQRGLKRVFIPVPVLTPRLSSLWLGLVTPLYARIGRKLVDSARYETIVTNNAALKTFSVRPRGIREAIARALEREDKKFGLTRWSDALSSAGHVTSWGGVRFGNRIVDSRSVKVAASAEQAFKVVQRIGGESGWYYGTWLWRLRGFLDLLVGGVGLRRGRRHPTDLKAGDTVDFWRVEEIDAPRLLRLNAEMKLPGRAWLQFEVDPAENGSVIRQTAIFDPLGLFGLLYWYGLYPLHQIIFAGLIAGISRHSETTTS